MKINLTSLLLLGALTLPITASAQERGNASAPLETIAALDVPRYMGTWYEIAKYPNWFQRKCAKDTRAEYRLAEAGQVSVTNRCRTADGETIEAMDLARQIGPASSPKLQVRFAPAWLSFLPFVWGNYWVIDLDEAYQLAAISEPGRDYLWILARTPTIDATAYDALLARLAARGFDLKRLERSQPE